MKSVRYILLGLLATGAIQTVYGSQKNTKVTAFDTYEAQAQAAEQEAQIETQKAQAAIKLADQAQADAQKAKNIAEPLIRRNSESRDKEIQKQAKDATREWQRRESIAIKAEIEKQDARSKASQAREQAQIARAVAQQQKAQKKQNGFFARLRNRMRRKPRSQQSDELLIERREKPQLNNFVSMP